METKPLTMRQKNILVLYGFKYSYQQIGNMLGIKKDAVKQDLLKVYDQLNKHDAALALLTCLLQNEITAADIKCLYYTAYKL